MPLRELQCMTCGRKLTELVRSCEYAEWRAAADRGEFTHEVTLDDGFIVQCGVLRYVVSLPATTVNRDWPYTFAPWTLPLKDGKPQVGVTVGSRAEYKQVLRMYGMVEPITDGEKLTMYGDQPKDNIDQQVAGDVQMYRALKNDPVAARRIINESIARRDAAMQE